MTKVGRSEGTCRVCGQEVRRWSTRTGWKHVRNWRVNLPACPDSPPQFVQEFGDPVSTIQPRWDHARWDRVEDYAHAIAAGDPHFWACRCGYSPDARDLPGYADATPEHQRLLCAWNYLRLVGHNERCAAAVRAL